MANEITLSASLEFLKATIGSSLSESALTFDVSGTDYVQASQAVGTTDEALDIGNITTLGYLFIKNMDSTNFVVYRDADDQGNAVKIKAGEIALFRAGTAAPFVMADTAECIINYLAIED